MAMALLFIAVVVVVAVTRVTLLFFLPIRFHVTVFLFARQN
jgi:hypothetical protein